MHRIRNYAVLACLLAFSAASFARDLAMVEAKTGSLRTVSAAELTKALKTTKKWPNGKEITIVMTEAGTRIFAQKMLGQTPDEFKAFVASANAGHKTIIIVASDSDVMSTVNSTPGSIGLIDVYSINGSVTALKIDGKLPLEPGYALHGV